jgi:hypothetical protein
MAFGLPGHWTKTEFEGRHPNFLEMGEGKGTVEFVKLDRTWNGAVSEPFFCFAPAQLGDWQINPGTPYIARYRYVVLDGPQDSVELERMWNDYAHPPIVKVEEQ